MHAYVLCACRVGLSLTQHHAQAIHAEGAKDVSTIGMLGRHVCMNVRVEGLSLTQRRAEAIHAEAAKDVSSMGMLGRHVCMYLRVHNLPACVHYMKRR